MQSGGVTPKTTCKCISKLQKRFLGEHRYSYTVNIVTSTEDTDGDWTKLQDYRRLLRALGILPNENKTKAKRPRATAGDESGRRVKHKSDFNDYDKTVVIK